MISGVELIERGGTVGLEGDPEAKGKARTFFFRGHPGWRAGGLLLIGVAGIIVYAFSFSTAWIFLAFGSAACATFGRSYCEKCDREVLVCCIVWALAGISAAALALTKVSTSHFSPDLFFLLFFSLIASACFVALALAIRPRLLVADPTPASVPRLIGCRILVWTAFIFGVLNGTDSFGGIANAVAGPPNSTFVLGPYGNWIHYWCRGAVRNNSIIVMEPGYMLPSYALHWMQQRTSKR